MHNFRIAIRYVLVRNIWYFEMKRVYEVYGFDGGTQEPHNIVLRERWKKNGHWHQEVKTRWLFIAFITFAYRRLSQFNAVFFSFSSSFIQLHASHFALFSPYLGNCFLRRYLSCRFCVSIFVVCSYVSLEYHEYALLE